MKSGRKERQESHRLCSGEFKEYRKEDLERILTEEGCRLRLNRSIQAEGSFVELKHDMGFCWLLCRGTQNVLAESTLLAMAHNINKLHRKIQGDRTGTHLFQLKKAASVWPLIIAQRGKKMLPHL